MERKLYSIGEIAKLSKLTHKTLRHYDEFNLLKPDYVNQNNGYRYYSEYQILKLQNIVSLKSAGFTLEEIKNRFEENSVRDLKKFLKTYERKKLEIEEKILELEKNKEKISKILEEFSYLEVDKIVLKNLSTRYLYSIDEIKSNNLNNSIIDIYKIIEASVGCGNAHLGKR